MKTVLFFLLFPAFAYGQTIHVKDKKIVYEGKEDLGRPMNPVTEVQLERILGIQAQVRRTGREVGCRLRKNEIKDSLPSHALCELSLQINHIR